MKSTPDKIKQQLLDRQDLRQALIHRQNALEFKIARVEQEIQKLKAA